MGAVIINRIPKISIDIYAVFHRSITSAHVKHMSIADIALKKEISRQKSFKVNSFL